MVHGRDEAKDTYTKSRVCDLHSVVVTSLITAVTNLLHNLRDVFGNAELLRLLVKCPSFHTSAFLAFRRRANGLTVRGDL